MFINYMIVFLVFMVGVFIGGSISAYRWSSNSQEAKRILYRKNWYKVIRLHDYRSREYFKQVD